MNNQNLIEQIKEWIKALFKKKGQVNTNCPPNHVFNPVTNICEPIQTEPVCPTGFTYNPTTGLCESDVTEDPEPPTYPDEPTGTCPIGYSFNDVSRFCENSTGEKVLPEGWIFDEETQLPIKPIYNYNFPENAYFLSPNESGQFTKEMIESAVTAGNNYIVFDAPRWDIYYQQTYNDTTKAGIHAKLANLKGTEESPIIFDFRKCFINCIPSTIPEFINKGHKVFELVNCENITIKTWRVDGDKFKREFLTNEDGNNESTSFVRVGEGTKNLTLDGGFIRGFMGDVSSVNVLGPNIDAFPLSKQFYLQPDGRYESVFYNVNSVTYKKFGLTGGLGYNRLLYYDMEDITYKMYDVNNVLLGEINGAKYFQRNTFIEGTKKIKVNVRPMDGRIENPTNFGHRLVHNPSQGITVKGVDIFDNHRGGLANLGSLAIVENCEFYNTTIYNKTQKFGNIGMQNSTTYHINCEDAVARDLVIKNCEFKNKFHNILLTHNINVAIENNKFKGAYGIYAYDLLFGEVTGNEFISTGVVNLGKGTNFGAVKVHTNTGKPNVQLSNGAEWYNNTFEDSNISGKGQCHHNTFNQCSFASILFTKEIVNNTFNGFKNVQYIQPLAYIYMNTFNDVLLTFQHGYITDAPSVLDSVTINNINRANDIMLSRTFSAHPLYFVDSTFHYPKLKHSSINKAATTVEGQWFFEGCTFTNISEYLVLISKNISAPLNPIIFNFKNCTFQGSGFFVQLSYVTQDYQINFDNCTIDPNITLPENHNFISIPDLVLVEPRTQPIPKITKYEGLDIIDAGFHHMTLKIRDKRTNEIVLDKVVTKNYQHHYEGDAEGATAFEYSIDGGKYWD